MGLVQKWLREEHKHDMTIHSHVLSDNSLVYYIFNSYKEDSEKYKESYEIAQEERIQELLNQIL